MEQEFKRGDIWICDLSGATGSEQSGIERPCLIISNNLGNLRSPNVTISPLTSSTSKTKMPTHVFIKSRENGLERDSVVTLETIRTLDKWNLMYKVATLTVEEMKQVDYAIDVSLDRLKDRK